VTSNRALRVRAQVTWLPEGELGSNRSMTMAGRDAKRHGWFVLSRGCSPGTPLMSSALCASSPPLPALPTVSMHSVPKGRKGAAVGLTRRDSKSDRGSANPEMVSSSCPTHRGGVVGGLRLTFQFWQPAGHLGTACLPRGLRSSSASASPRKSGQSAVPFPSSSRLSWECCHPAVHLNLADVQTVGRTVDGLMIKAQNPMIPALGRPAPRPRGL
jgi:hypothetical protein